LRRPFGQLCHFVNYRGENFGIFRGEVGIRHVDGIAVDNIFRGGDRACFLASFRLRKEGVSDNSCVDVGAQRKRAMT
jgi:hypothetical protein